MTENLRTIGAIPLRIEDAPPLLEVRGEVYLPLAAFARLNEQRAEAGRAHVRQPAQLGGGLDPPARPEAHRLTAAVDVGVRDRRPRGGGVRLAVGVARVAARARLPREPRRRGARRPRRGRGRLPRLGGPARPARLRDRRRGGEGGRPGAAAAARSGGPRAARRDRLEVRAEHRHHRARARGLERGSHRPHDPVRPARAGPGLRGDREARDAAQRGGPAAQGRARGRRGDRDARRRRDPAGGVAHRQGAALEEAASEARRPRPSARPAARPPSSPRRASGRSAPTARPARASSSRR